MGWRFVDSGYDMVQLRRISLWKFQQDYELPDEAAAEGARLVGASLTVFAVRCAACLEAGFIVTNTTTPSIHFVYLRHCLLYNELQK